MTNPNQKEISHAEADGALAELVTRAEYDVQIATAQKYPRSIKQFMDDAMSMVTLNEAVADECIYALPRDGKTIEGPSARFAEIIFSAWGHARAGARIVNEDAKFVTAQGVCHDLQKNTLIAFEVRRRITNKHGTRYNDDMIGVTGNAGSSIALRNAILKTIPKAFWSPIYEAARKTVMGDHKTLAARRDTALAVLMKFGATPDIVFKLLNIKGVEDITPDHLIIMKGLATALRDGDTTLEQLLQDAGQEQEGKGTAGLKDKLRKKTGAPKPEQGDKPLSGEPEQKQSGDAPATAGRTNEAQQGGSSAGAAQGRTVSFKEPEQKKPAVIEEDAVIDHETGEILNDLSTVAGTKKAGDSLLKALYKAQPDERTAVFAEHDGDKILKALGDKGLGMVAQKIRTAAGI